MATKAKLKVILKANETVVAETEDANLWQQILAAINSGTTTNIGHGAPVETKSLGALGAPTPPLNTNDPVAKFAYYLGVTVEEVKGALDPQLEAPYLHLDSHAWEAMKKGLPQRGPGSITPIGLAGTVLALWVKEAGLNITATQNLVGAVLNTIGLNDKNPTRGIKNSKWLQARAGGVIIINPASISKAKEIAKSFCTGKWSAETV